MDEHNKLYSTNIVSKCKAPGSFWRKACPGQFSFGRVFHESGLCATNRRREVAPLINNMTTMTREMNGASPDRSPRMQGQVETPKTKNVVPREAQQFEGSDSITSSTTASLSTSTNEDKPQYRVKPSQHSQSLFLNTVSGIKDAATKTYQSVSSWANSTHSKLPSGSFLNGCVHLQDDNVTSGTTAIRSTSVNEDKPQYGGTPLQYSQSLLSGTVSGINEAATCTFQNVANWAKSPHLRVPSERFLPGCAQVPEDKSMHEYTVNPLTCSPERKMNAESQSFPPSRESPRNHQSARTKPLSPAQSLIQDLVSPFLACSSDPDGQSGTQEISMNAMLSKIKLHNKRIFEPWEPDDIQSVASIDSQEEEERQQLHRLTSWGTTGTFGTVGTYDTAESLNTARTATPGDSVIDSSAFSNSSALNNEVVIQDDDGNVIPPQLIEHAQRRRNQRRTRRKRVVKFSYPPISSLRECPRANRADLPNLFFTEEELDEIEADRSSANIADDVEIVAVASSQDDWNISNKSGSSDIGLGYNHAVPNKSAKKRPASPHPRKESFAAHPGEKSPRMDSPADSPTRNEKPKSDSRLLKGVQIYLRERTTGQSR